MKRCKDCGADISNLHHHAKRCRECQVHYRLELSRNTRFLKRKFIKKLGTTDFDQHRKETDEQELVDVWREMRRLGLR